jgi:site-specific DNA recombinase
MQVAIYTRISRDENDARHGVERQEADCRALAERLGWEIVAVFTDNDISASTSSRKPRPAYAEMIEAVRVGQVGGIVAYSNSRLTRRVREYLDLIELHRETRVQIKTCVSGDADLSTADGRALAITLATWDAAEAERTSERLRRQKHDRAARGLPQGGRYRVYGYTRNFEVVNAEAEVVREIFTRRASGESATSIARDLADRGITTTSGKRWRQSSVSKLISRPGYCGLREHNGQIVGPTSYPHLVEESLWRAATGEAAKSSPGTNARKHLLSGIAVCGKCSASMVGGPRGYRCHSVHGGCGRIRVKAPWLEGPVISLIMAAEAVPKPRLVLEAATVDLGAIDTEIVAVRASYEAGDLDLADMTPILRSLRAKRRAAEDAMAKTPPATAIGGSLMLWLTWRDLDLSQQRALIGRHIDSIVVGPRRSTGPGRFEPERYTIRWRDGRSQRLRAADLDGIPAYDPETGNIAPNGAKFNLMLGPVNWSDDSLGQAQVTI